MARAKVADFDDDDENWDGFQNDTGENNVIGEVEIYNEEIRKVAGTKDKFAAVPFEALDNNAKRRVKYQIKKNLQGQGGAKSKSWDVEQINGYELYGLAMPPYNLDNLVDLSVENDTHYACIVTKTTNIVGLGYQWKERAKVKEARQAVEDDDAKMLKLAKKLQRTVEGLDELVEGLNTEEDFNEILAAMWFDVEATGNGYLEIGRTISGKIGYIGYIPSATMRVRKDRDGFIQIVQDKITFFRNFGDTTTTDPLGKDSSPNEIIHFKKHTSKNIYYGIPDIIAAMTSVAGQKFSSEYNLDYFENKAVPRYALIVKGAKLSAAAERRILEYFRKEVKGKHHGTLYIPVPAHMGSNVDVKLEAIENKVQEASFEKYRSGNHESIAMVHRVPKSKIGLGVGVAAAREEDKSFKYQVCKPEQRRVAKKINRIVAEFTDMYYFVFEEYDLLDAETQSRIHDRYIRLGVESPNEARAMVGYTPRKGGDKFTSIAAESAAKVKLIDAQGDLAAAQADATEQQSGAESAPDASGIGVAGGQGPGRKTTDGSDKNKQQTSTPAGDKPEGVGTRGVAEDKGQVPKSTRR
jgi:PBSX family phage portal protein